MSEEDEATRPSFQAETIDDDVEMKPASNSSSSTILSVGRDSFAIDFAHSTKTSTTTTRYAATSPTAIKCSCANAADDGFTIQCEQCLAWQHARCVGIASPVQVPGVFLCQACNGDDINVDSESRSTPTTTTTSVAATTTNTATVGGSPKNARKKVLKKRKKSLPTSTVFQSASPPKAALAHGIAVAEISENIISSKAQGLMDALKRELLQLPVAPKSSESYAGRSFEFVDAIRMESMFDLEAAFKQTEVKEAKPMNGRKSATRFGVFATQAIDLGLLIGEFRGQVRIIDDTLEESTKQEWIPQSFVLFPNAPRTGIWWSSEEDFTLLVVDARRFGSLLRYTRRSCRPNCNVKVVLVKDASIHWVIASSNSIAAGEELLLPLDFGHPYNDGVFYYECACGLLDELCLSPYAHLMPKRSAAGQRKSTTGSSFRSIDDPKPHSASDDPSRKLTREERKLQRYIEFFDRMDSIERKQASRKSGDSSASRPGSRRASTPTKPDIDGGAPSAMKRRATSSSKSPSSDTIELSPKKRSTLNSPGRTALHPKKAWLSSYKHQQQSTPPAHALREEQHVERTTTPGAAEPDELIDVVGGSTTPAPQQTTCSEAMSSSEVKKRLSLSDYMQRRRATIEERSPDRQAEIVSPAPRKVFTPEPAQPTQQVAKPVTPPAGQTKPLGTAAEPSLREARYERVSREYGTEDRYRRDFSPRREARLERHGGDNQPVRCEGADRHADQAVGASSSNASSPSESFLHEDFDRQQPPLSQQRYDRPYHRPHQSEYNNRHNRPQLPYHGQRSGYRGTRGAYAGASSRRYHNRNDSRPYHHDHRAQTNLQNSDHRDNSRPYDARLGSSSEQHQPPPARQSD